MEMSVITKKVITMLRLYIIIAASKYCMFELDFCFRREQQVAMYAKKRKSILRPVIRQEVRLDRLSKKRAYKSGSEPPR